LAWIKERSAVCDFELKAMEGPDPWLLARDQLLASARFVRGGTKRRNQSVSFARNRSFDQPGFGK
jgi:hypothetical protein